MLAAAGAAGASRAVAGATACSCLASEPKSGSSNRGPLVALMPAAGLLAGIVGKSKGAAGAVSVVVVVGASVALASASTGAAVAGV